MTDKQKGFTLLEVIITLTVSVVLGVMLYQYMGTSMTRSSEPVLMIQRGFSLNHAMESIASDYKKLVTTDSTPLQTLKTNVETNYGAYNPVTKFIEFDGSGVEKATPCATDCKVLKVTLTQVTPTQSKQSLTALFTK
jgi:prepilin-type N-terminal cleavage/methylation domain-containing protein